MLPLNPKRKHALIFFLLLLVFTLFPLIPVLLASTIANLNDCRLDEAGFYPCIVLGVDMGELLGTMAMLGWFGIITLPLGGVLSCIGLGRLIWVFVTTCAE